MLSTPIWILIVILAVVLGAVGGFFFARKYIQDYYAENPPIDETSIRLMMSQMGQKPSEAKVRQVMASIKSQAKKRNTKKTK